MIAPLSKNSWKPWVQLCLNTLLPAACLVCQKDLGKEAKNGVCLACLSKISFTSNPYRTLSPFTMVFSPLDFSGPTREIIHALKYRGKSYLAPLLIDIWMRTFDLSTEKVSAIVPVPLPFWREISRGYNQAELISREIGRRLNCPIQNRWLWRRGMAPSQTNLNRSKRIQNAKRSFGIRKVDKKRVPKRVLLVDDVFTTGSTLTACAELLLHAGVEEVFGTTLAFENLKNN